ncbi:MAG: PP2C family protein-serine/threonine phosphatase [Clostridiales bacterium]|nr:PP2C family protein-serine/threonine phosphatase [Clostridiales bacterium]
MKKWLKSLRLQILLPVLAMNLFVVGLLSTLFSRGFTGMVLQQEQAVNSTGFETITGTVPPSITTAIGSVRDVVTDLRVISCIRLSFASDAEMYNSKAACVEYLRDKITHAAWANGLFIMRKDGSIFGTLPDGNYFHDDPKDNPLPEEMRQRILDVPLGQTVWVGPVSGAVMYGFENKNTPRGYLIAAWRAVDVRFGECFVMMLIDQAAFDRLFSTLEDGKSTWRIFDADGKELYHTGPDASRDPERLFAESDSGNLYDDENGLTFSAFSMKMASPEWTLVREVSMEETDRIIRGIRSSVVILDSIVILFSLGCYILWLKKFMRQFGKLVNGISRMGKEIEPLKGVPFSTTEFETMQHEINQTSVELKEQMETIRRMERDRVELENEKKEQQRIAQELSMAREIQESALPHVFPPFPDRTEFSIFASMTPARAVGGDFYDFFLIDSDHLALVIADVSGKGIPAALFMMVSKTMIQNQLMTGSSPAEALAEVNRQLCERNSSMMFVTVWLAVLEISTGKGMACNAGHENPCIRRAGGDFELLEYAHDMFVGVRKKAVYHNREFELHPGDYVFVYTDGVPEANGENDTMFGEERMVVALNSCGNGSPEEIVRGMRSAVDAFVGGTEQFDDITMLCVSYGENPIPPAAR